MPDSSPPRDQIELALIARYLAGECTPEERQRVRAWIDAVPGRDVQIVETMAAWKIRDSGEASRGDAIWNRIEGRIREVGDPAVRDDVAGTLSSEPVRHPRRLPGIGRSASVPALRGFTRNLARAAAIVVLVSGAWWLSRHREMPAPPTAMREVTTRRGERAEIDLSDGSHITLGFGSKVRFPSDMSAGAREVTLDGEALFTVLHVEGHPFTVHTARSQTRVTGTKFIVRSLSGDTQDRIVVASGSVRSGTARDTTRFNMLSRADLLTVRADGSTGLQHGIAVESYLRWMRGSIDLDRTKFRDAVTDLERRYDIDITVSDPSLLSRSITASFGEESLKSVLETLAEILGARYTREGQRVRFIPDANDSPGKRFRRLRTDTGAVRIGLGLGVITFGDCS